MIECIMLVAYMALVVATVLLAIVGVGLVMIVGLMLLEGRL